MKFQMITILFAAAIAATAVEPYAVMDAGHLPKKVRNVKVEKGRLVFNGKDSYAELPNVAAPASYTYTAWIKPLKKAGSSTIVNKQGFHTSLKYTEWNSFYFSTYTEDKKFIQICAPKKYKAGKWYFIAGGYDAKTGKLWIAVDGEITEEQVLKKPLLKNNGKYFFGSTLAKPGTGNFLGEIGRISIYHDTIPEAELEKMYQAGKDTWK